jgi:hypothetical protein
LPLGNLTSQFFANLYLDGLDHFCREVLRAHGYLRYVDDFALFHDDPAVLEAWRERIETYLEGRRLRLHPRKTVIRPDGRAGGVPGLRACARTPPASRRERAAVPQPLARLARPGARRRLERG